MNYHLTSKPQSRFTPTGRHTNHRGPNDLYKGSALTLLISLGLEDLQHAIEELDLGSPTVDQVALAPSVAKTQKY